MDKVNLFGRKYFNTVLKYISTLEFMFKMKTLFVFTELFNLTSGPGDKIAQQVIKLNSIRTVN